MTLKDQLEMQELRVEGQRLGQDHAEWLREGFKGSLVRVLPEQGSFLSVPFKWKTRLSGHT